MFLTPINDQGPLSQSLVLTLSTLTFYSKTN